MDENRRQNFKYGGLALLVALIALCGLWQFNQPASHERSDAREAKRSERASTKTRKYDANSAKKRLREMIGEYETPKEQHEAQFRLRKALNEMDKEEAVGLILAYFETGADQKFQLPFKVGKDGVLLAAPTMRVLLLDVLGGLDTLAARKLAEEILKNMVSADEWAVSLRNVVWHARDPQQGYKPEDLVYVKGKLNEMFSHEPWLEAPSNGCLGLIKMADCSD